MGEWVAVALGSLGSNVPGAFSAGPFGSAVSAKNWVPSGIPMLRGSNLSEDVGQRLDDGEVVYVDEALAKKFKRSIATRGDLIFTCWGTVGQIGLVDGSSRSSRYLVSNKQMKMTPDDRRVDSLFLYYYLSQPRMVQLVKSEAIGSSVPGFNLGQLKSLPVRLPGLAQQRAIAEVLGALDDKIAANDQARGTAEALGQASFAALAGSGARVRIGDIASMVKRGVAPKYNDEGMVVLNQKCIRDQRVSLAPSRRIPPMVSRLDRVLERNDTLVNSTGQGTLGRAARWVLDDRATVDSHITIIRFDSSMVDNVCAGYAVLDIESQIEGLAEGSTGQTELKRDLLASLEIRLPARENQRALGEQLGAIDYLGTALGNESRRLATARDELLPLLMSGKVRVKDAEKVVEDVV